MPEQLNIAVTGDVDSGKSTLIGRFLYESGSLPDGVLEGMGNAGQTAAGGFEFASLLDSLEEERKGQLTLDTAQAFCKPARGKEFIFIDVPGHKHLLKNMLCGSTYGDAAVLVIDAQKPIEEQTRRHAFILKFLGLGQVIVALNKMDSLDFSQAAFQAAKDEAALLCKEIGLKPEYFIPVSAKEGDNLLKRSKRMPWHKGVSLSEALNTCSGGNTSEDFRFPIQDIYVINGERIAVGRIISGRIKKNDAVDILPINKKFRVRQIREFRKNISSARAPGCVGLELDCAEGLERGQIICKPRLPRVSNRITARIFFTNPFRSDQKFIFKCLTQETGVKIMEVIHTWEAGIPGPVSGAAISNSSDAAEVILALEAPVVTESFNGANSLGRFVLRENEEPCALGIVV